MGEVSRNMIKLLIYSYLVLQITGDKNAPGNFSVRLETLLDELNRNFSMTDTTEKAKAKLQGEMFETWPLRKKNAALIINLYTSSDEISDAPGTTFYRSLNKELRNGNPGEIWQRCEDLLNEALDITGQEEFEHLYRGERYWLASFPDAGDTYNIRSFWSTTLDPSITEHFGGAKDFFYHIRGAKGVRVQNLSVTDDEKEVLIKSDSDYIVICVIRDQKGILRELRIIKNISSDFDVTKFRPKVLITLMEKEFYLRIKESTSATVLCNTSNSENSTRKIDNANGSETLVKYNFLLLTCLFPVIYKIALESIF